MHRRCLAPFHGSARLATVSGLLLLVLTGGPAIASGSPGTLPAGLSLLPDGTIMPPNASFEAPGSPALLPGSPSLPGYPNHPGWPVPVVGGASPPVCADLDPSYPGLETAVGTLSSGVNFYVFHQDGTLMAGYPINLGYWIAASPAIADINGDGLPEIVVSDFGHDRVWALHADGTPLPGWPITVGGNVRSTPALADLDPSYPGLEIIVGVQDGHVYAWHADGTLVPGWPVMAGDFVERCSPAVGDVNHDGYLEVFVGSWYDYAQGSTGGIYGFAHDGTTLPGWPKLTSTHTSVIASPVLADLDGDGYKEIIDGTYETNGKMYVWRYDGSDYPGWPYTIPRGASSTSYVSSSPAVGDIDGDGQLEIVDGSCGQCGTVYAWKKDGTVMSGWPFVANAVIDGSSPVLGDVDGDGKLEIVVGSGSGFTPTGCTSGAISQAYVLRADGTLEPGWPVNLGTATPPYPALADIDGDGLVEIVMAFSQNVYVWDAPGAYQPTLTPWPYYHLGIDHTGNFTSGPPTSVDETDLPGRIVPAVWPNPRVGDGPVFFRRADRSAGTASVLDSAGRLVRCVTGGRWDGRDESGRAVPPGVYFLREGGASKSARVVVIR